MIQVQIEGSSGTPYVVMFDRDGKLLRTSCTCPAGEKRMHCKHRIALFSGDLTQIRSVQPPDLKQQILAMLEGTDVAVALAELISAENESKTATDKCKKAKKHLDRVMHK